MRHGVSASPAISRAPILARLITPALIAQHRRRHWRQLLTLYAGCCWIAVTTATAWAATEQQVRRNEAEQHFEQGRKAYGSGDYKKAEEEFSKSLNLLEAGSLTAPNAASTVPLLAPPLFEPLPMTQQGATAGATLVPVTQAAAPPTTVASDSSLVASERPATSDQRPATGSPAAAPVMPYLLSIGDVLAVAVWQVPDLTHDVTVRPDGRISFPLVGDVPAEGLTFSELNQLLTDRLKLYVREPHVSIELKGTAQQRIAVLGEVNKQGLFALPGRTVTVPEALALSEGFKRIGAKVRDVAVLKNYPKNPRLYHVNVRMLLTKGEDPQRLVLSGGDIVFVSRSWVGDAHAFIDATTPALNTAFQGLSTYALYDTIVTKSNTSSQ